MYMCHHLTFLLSKTHLLHFIKMITLFLLIIWFYIYYYYKQHHNIRNINNNLLRYFLSPLFEIEFATHIRRRRNPTKVNIELLSSSTIWIIKFLFNIVTSTNFLQWWYIGFSAMMKDDLILIRHKIYRSMLVTTT